MVLKSGGLVENLLKVLNEEPHFLTDLVRKTSKVSAVLSRRIWLAVEPTLEVTSPRCDEDQILALNICPPVQTVQLVQTG